MYHVEWRDAALADLPNGWLAADTSLRADITSAIHEIDRLLLRAPDRAGETRKPGTRVIILKPLTITFHVNTRTNVVLVSSVRVYRRRS